MSLIHKDPYSYSPIGHVDSDGLIHSDSHSFSPIGHIDSDGLVHSDPHSFSPIGHVDSDGLVHSDPYSFSPIGHVDSDGRIHSDPHSFSPIGHVDSTSAKEGGAALLLLMKSSSYECSNCGSKGHSTADCPHGISSSRSSPRQETESYSSSSDENGCAKIIGWLIGIVIVVFAVIWLAVNIVLPVALLNSALALTILALCFKKHKILFAGLALVGGCYMLMDILNGWFSANFVNKVVKDPAWISGFAYINAAAIGLSSWLLVQPIWSNAIQIRASDKRKSIMLMSISIFLVAIATITIPTVYHSIQNPFATKFNSGGKVTYDNAPVPFGNTESEQTKTPPGITHSEAKNVDELPSDTKIVTLISPTYTFGDLPHLTFKDVATNEEQEYECDWSLPAIKEIMTKCENQDGCPALKGQVYNVTLELKLMDIMNFDPESGGMKPTGKKEKRWVIIAAKKISTPEKITPTQNKRPFRAKASEAPSLDTSNTDYFGKYWDKKHDGFIILHSNGTFAHHWHSNEPDPANFGQFEIIEGKLRVYVGNDRTKFEDLKIVGKTIWINETTTYVKD